ncbi:hypothetical protein G7Z17_g15 [Cylindrodendrum hubeiense]|uniref:Uncharacterized protein n=1 Tax=Cylindrodendrum hubeiense TaxID=595255 RepID=A0A9P5LGK5_9HYPO|nr:hypothetical protein G7Z17_g15 [Cylindrodendrum hubeiense]
MSQRQDVSSASGHLDVLPILDPTGESGTATTGPGRSATAQMQQGNPFAVDIVAIYAFNGPDGISVFDSEKQPTQDKSTKGHLPDPKQQGQQASTTGTKAIQGAEGTKRIFNWLKDEDMLRSRLNVVRIIGFGVNLASRPSDLIGLKQLALEIAQELQKRNFGSGSRPVVLIGQGYGTLLIEKIFTDESVRGKFSDVIEKLESGTAAVGFFAAPTSMNNTRLKGWANDLWNVSKESKIFQDLPTPDESYVLKDFYEHVSQCNMLTFAFQKKGKKGEVQQTDGEDMRPMKGKKESRNQVYQADKVWEREESFGDLARMSGPRNPDFQFMTDFLIQAIETHQLLETAKRGDGGIAQLTSRCTDLNRANRWGATALHVAAQHNQLDNVKSLLSTGKVDPDQQDKAGLTALHISVLENHTNAYEMAKELLESGANPRLVDVSKKETPAELARRLIEDDRKHSTLNGGKDVDPKLTSRRERMKMVWIHDLFATLDCHVWPWPQGYRDSSLPHSRAVYPQIVKLNPLDEASETSGQTVWAIMMPYISYEAYARQEAISRLIKKARTQFGKLPFSLVGDPGHGYRDWFVRKLERRSKIREEDTITDGTKEAIEAYLNFEHKSDYGHYLPLHPRRSQRSPARQLRKWEEDEIPETDKLLHHLPQFGKPIRFDERGPSPGTWQDDQRKSHNILMVDQLWLWIIQPKNQTQGQFEDRTGDSDSTSPCTVISSFPYRKGASPSAIDDLQKQILKDKTKGPFKSPFDLVDQIVAICCGTLIPNQDKKSVNFLQFFESSIAHVEERSAQLFQKFRLLSIVLKDLDDEHPDYQNRRRILLSKHLDISDELKPLTEVKDIIDETKMILTILDEQAALLYGSKIDDSNFHQKSPFAKAKSSIHRAMGSFQTLKERAEDVLKSIEHLLDLKQKQANVWEARMSRERAEETAKQGNTLLVFTVVTVIFVRP